MTLYMAVTADEYELPLVVESQIYLLAKKLNRSRRTVTEELSRNRNGKFDGNGKNKGYLLKEIEVKEDD